MSYGALSEAGNIPLYLSRHLDAVGDGSGNKNFNGDYSGAQEIAFIQPANGVIYRIARMIVIIEDTTGMQQQEYGNLGSGLDPGIGLRIQDDSGTVVDLLDSVKVTTNGEWGHFNFDVDIKTWGAGNEQLLARWTFEKAGWPLRLDGSNNERLEVTLDNDLQGLLGHFFLVQGYQEGNLT